MDFEAFLNEMRSSPVYRKQIVHSHIQPERDPCYSDTRAPLTAGCSAFLESRGIAKLYRHQAEAIDAAREGSDALIVTGTASGKSLCYQIPLLEMIERQPESRALLLYPTKALAQDQYQAFGRALQSLGASHALVGVFDGDTPANMRRKLRDEARLILTNPDMLHAALMPQHARWADLIRRLRYVVVDEVHAYSGLFGSNAANLFRRLARVCNHYGSHPTFIACSATVGNPDELASKLTGREFSLIDSDGSPRGKKTFIFWNPPRIRATRFRSRRSANVEAQELMTELIRARIPTITFSKAKVTAELIYRYVVESLERLEPPLARKVTPYRGGYLPEERREIERRLFSGELIGVSTTPALELGIDVGGLDASIIVGYPGTLASFFQQAGRAGRRDRESLAILVAVDTSINQYIMNHPEYVFGRPVERSVLDPDNPYVLAGQLRCAAFELPIDETELQLFGKRAGTVLDVLTEQKKLNKVGTKWYHASDDIPQHDVGLRDFPDHSVEIIDVETSQIIGEMEKYDAQAMLHPDAIYLHQGETFLVLDLDLERYLCYVQKVVVDYYTQPLGGTDVHHIDQPLRERDFGIARAYFGEVTSYFKNVEFERIHFYSLDAISRHPLNLPTYQLETQALWLTPSEELIRQIIAEGLDVHRGLMGIGYATRMILPLFVACETSDFSHSSCTAVNAAWHTVFVYERYPHGLGFTEKAFEMLSELLPVVRDRIRNCECSSGCPCCVGKPLRSFSTWNIERGEGSIPSKKAALRILDAVIGDGSRLHVQDLDSLGQTDAEREALIERSLRRRLERMGDPDVFHPVDPNPEVGFPAVDKEAITTDSDIARRALKRMRLEKNEASVEGKLRALHRWRLRTPEFLKGPEGQDIDPSEGTPDGIRQSQVGPVTPGGTPGDSSRIANIPAPEHADLEHERVRKPPDIRLGDSIAGRARRMRGRRNN